MNLASERLRDKAFFNTASGHFSQRSKTFPNLTQTRHSTHHPSIHSRSSHMHGLSLFVWPPRTLFRSAPRLNFPFSANFTRIIIGRPKTIKPHERQREREGAHCPTGGGERPLPCLNLPPLPPLPLSSLPSSASVNKLLSVLLCNNLISPATCSKIHLLLAITAWNIGFEREFDYLFGRQSIT